MSVGTWLRELLNRPSTEIDRRVFEFDAWEPAGWQAVREHRWLTRGGEGGLLAVLTTHHRSQSALRVVEALAESSRRWCEEEPERRMRLLVLEDWSEDDYAEARARARKLFGDNLGWYRAREQFGKRGFWAVHQLAMAVAEAQKPELILYLQDDLELDPNVVKKSVTLHQTLVGRLDQGRRPGVVLNLFASADDEPGGRWIRFERQDVPGLPTRQTQWFDLAAFLIDRETLKCLRYRVLPVPESRWQKDPTLSSGVGRQLTRRLHGRALIYQCSPPLVFHGAEASRMNPETRGVRAMDNRGMREGG